ncbi:MAG: hypothetical protein PSN44_03535, partial [Gammaproteobacteria bacterium]|nr:hypothetical protein [Gammaproteobacteria bacterium]
RAYCDWITRFVQFHHLQARETLLIEPKKKVEEFLTHLAVHVARLQSYMNTERALSSEVLETVPAFKKLGVDTEISVIELDENSDEYAEAMALFGF